MSAGSEATIAASTIEYQGLSLPDSTHAVCTMGTDTTSVDTIVVEISGSSLTPLTSYQNVSGDKNYVTSCATGSNWVLVAYEDADNSNYGTAIVLGV